MKQRPVVYATSMSVLLSILLWLVACGSPEIQFAVKHLRDLTGEQLTEEVSYEEEAGLDNSSGAEALQVQIQLYRPYHYKINERMTSEEVSGQRVREKIVELYRLPPNDPEGTEQKALCPISVVIPAGNKAIITVEWTERWAEGVVNEGEEAQGKQLGNYSVFLGYTEPCSMVKQDNIPTNGQ